MSVLSRQFTKANSESLSRADSATLSTGDIDFFVCGWFRLDTTATLGILAAKSHDTSTREWALFVDTTPNVVMRIYNAAGTASGEKIHTTGLSTATPYFVLAYHDSVNNLVGISLNGGAFLTGATSGVPTDTGAIFRIGAHFNTAAAFFDGQIGRFGFGKTIPTTAQLARLYNDGQARRYSELEADLQALFANGDFWDLNEESGNATASVNSQTLTDNNTVTSASGIPWNAFATVEGVCHPYYDHLATVEAITDQPLIWPAQIEAFTDQPLVWPSLPEAFTDQPLVWPSTPEAVTHPVRYPPYEPPPPPPDNDPPDPPRPPRPPRPPGPPRPVGPPIRLFFRPRFDQGIVVPDYRVFDDLLLPGGLGVSSPSGGNNPPPGTPGGIYVIGSGIGGVRFNIGG